MKPACALTYLITIILTVTGSSSFSQDSQTSKKQFEVRSVPAYRPDWVKSLTQSTEPTLVILAYFTDTKPPFAKTTQQDWNRTFFGSNPSIKDYFEKISFGKVNLTPAEDTDGEPNNGVVGWYQLLNTFDYYKQFGKDSLAHIAREAIVWARNDLNFANYDTNKDGYIAPHELHIYVIVAAFDKQYDAYGMPDDPTVYRVHFPLVRKDGSRNIRTIVDGVEIGNETVGGGVSFAG